MSDSFTVKNNRKSKNSFYQQFIFRGNAARFTIGLGWTPKMTGVVDGGSRGFGWSIRGSMPRPLRRRSEWLFLFFFRRSVGGERQPINKHSTPVASRSKTIAVGSRSDVVKTNPSKVYLNLKYEYCECSRKSIRTRTFFKYFWHF